MIKPLGDRLVVKVVEQKEQIGKILIATNAQEKSNIGEVVAVSIEDVNDLIAPKTVKKGDIVYFDQYSGQKVNIDGEEYLIFHEKDIIGINE